MTRVNADQCQYGATAVQADRIPHELFRISLNSEAQVRRRSTTRPLQQTRRWRTRPVHRARCARGGHLPAGPMQGDLERRR